MSVLLGICPEEPFQPYTFMHTKYNHINKSPPLVNTPRNKYRFTNFSVQWKKKSLWYMPEREGREYLSWSQEHRKKHSVHRSSHLAPDSYLIHLPIHDFFLQDIANKSLTLSRLLGFPLLWILQGNTLCQFNQLSLTVFRWSQYPDDRLKHPSSPSWFLQVGLWNLSKAKPIFFCLHTIFFLFEWRQAVPEHKRYKGYTFQMQSISVFLSPDTSCMKKTDYMYFELNSPTALQMQAELAGLNSSIETT